MHIITTEQILAFDPPHQLLFYLLFSKNKIHNYVGNEKFGY